MTADCTCRNDRSKITDTYIMETAQLGLLIGGSSVATLQPTTLLGGILGVDSARRQRRTSLVYGSIHKRRTLYCRGSGGLLQIWPDGTVNGTTDQKDPFGYTILKFFTISNVAALVNIQGVKSQNYLCMNASGIVYGSPNLTDECQFFETMRPSYYNTYSSEKYRGKKGQRWYLALDSKGRPKPGPKARPEKKQSMFLPMNIPSENKIKPSVKIFNNFSLRDIVNSKFGKTRPSGNSLTGILPLPNRLVTEVVPKKNKIRHCRNGRKLHQRANRRIRCRRRRHKNTNRRRKRRRHGRNRRNRNRNKKHRNHNRKMKKSKTRKKG